MVRLKCQEEIRLFKMEVEVEVEVEVEDSKTPRDQFRHGDARMQGVFDALRIGENTFRHGS